MDELRANRNVDAIIDEASQWLVRLGAPEVSVKERREFVAWLKRSPVHLGEYLKMERTWTELGEVDADRTVSVADLLAAEDSNVIELEPAATVSGAPPSRRSPRRFGAALAACAVFAVAALFAFQALVPGRYSTGVGEQRTIKLEDGSTIALNTDTAVRVELTEHMRRVSLLRGEALFNVAKDPARPFRVLSDGAIAQAIGTSFVVRRNDGDTVVTVIEGQVAVARFDQPSIAASAEVPAQALRLSAGVRADIVAADIQTSAVANIAAVTSWKSGRLIFDGQALSEVVAEFNRYNRTQIVLRDSQLSAEQLSGVFDADKPQALVRFLERANVIESARIEDDRIILTPRR
ncbi:FecR family protein [Peristeroidobacter soli]|uniref:FecR family protein n=1 Tax=Peristeroidobacter soli TaxID=2497877 RepID=UPI00101DC27A|nr:FecR domain-containing protein [Peristeroidobacter soli]